MQKTLLAALTTAIGLTVCCSDASAQIGGQSVPRYQPATPTTSPYLNLLRPNGGALTNYFSLVRPQQRQIEFNRQVQDFARRQTLENAEIEQRFLQPQTPVTGTAAGFMVPSASGTYQNYSHFYPAPQITRQRRR
ncbi:hypothetical protein Pla123a_07110 [Posidoniimonas polymericola]|uniref:Uncharacterized protein n=1 Tax=Posidoniimonas polymericola TaxID=2528002 RepID=A0A5C5ZEV8_9BACT|nr:hypothetical protein Pla123a_07110 [Posidoniimonas polymericola]